MTITIAEVRCKHCDSHRVIKYGHFKNVQRWWCNDCKRKFADNGAQPGQKTPTSRVTSALGMYYEGMSLNAIRRVLNQEHNNYPSDSTVYEWVDKHSRVAIDKAKDFHPKVGDTWVADETVLKIDGKNAWLWDIIDSDTRFLLATRLSRSRTKVDAQMLIDRARARAGKAPKVVVTDKLASYLDINYGKDAQHHHGGPFNVQSSTNLIERFHGTLKDRTKVMRGLKDLKSAKQFTDGWLVHYNFFRPHESLNDTTPASMARVVFPYRNWSDIIRAKPEKPKPVIVAEPPKVTVRVVEPKPSQSFPSPRISLSSVKTRRTSTPRISYPSYSSRITPKTPRLTGTMWTRGGLLSSHSLGRGSRVVNLGGDVVYSRRRGRHLRLY